VYNHDNRDPPPATGSESPLTGTPQTQQTNNTSDRPETPGGAARRGAAPHATPVSDTSVTPAASLASGATLTQSAPLSPAPATLNGDGTGQAPSGQDGGTAGPQSGTCTPVAGTWGTPANDAAVNNVPNRDPSAVQWDIDAQCTLTLHHGTSPDYLEGGDNFPWYPYRSSITKVRIDGSLTLYRTGSSQGSGPFNQLNESEIQIDGTLHISGAAGCNTFASFYLTAFTGNGIAAIETSQATNMSGMFGASKALTSLDLTHFDTSKVTNMNQMFEGCDKLSSLDVTRFDTSKVTNMYRMFANCPKLASLDVTNFDTSNVTVMYEMFFGCTALTSLDLTHFDTSKVTNMNAMFFDCEKLTSLDLTHFDTSNVTNMRTMFFECRALASLDLSNFNTSKVTDITSMFALCDKLASVDVTHFDTSNVTTMGYMFYGCNALTTLDLSNFITTNVDGSTSYQGFSGMFSNCESLESLNISGFDTSKAHHEEMFKNSSKLRELWLGPSTYLAMSHSDTSANLDPKNWVELTAPGGPTPVPDMYNRTEYGSGRNPQGHYVHVLLVVSVDYNNGQADHTQNLSFDPTIPGRKKIIWTDRQGTLRPAPEGKVFDGWDFTTSDPAHVTLTGSTVAWTAGLTVYATTTATLTARWRTVGQPALSINVHADGTANPDGGTGPWAEVTATLPAGSAADDTVRIESLNGTGRASDCTPAAGTNTCAVRVSIAQLRDASDYDAAYHVRATTTAMDRRAINVTTDTNTPVTGPATDKEGILPYTIISYRAGTGTGAPPAGGRALTDTASSTARLTIAGPSPINRPANSLFDTWQPGNVQPGPATVATATGTTDAQGRTTITLTAQWTLLTGPAGVSATRDPATNQVIISGTTKPRTDTDTVRVCHPADGGTQCHDVTTDATDTRGNRLPYDGATEHPWHITLPAGTPDGDWSVDTTLTTKDTAYPADNQQVDSPTTHTNIRIPTPYMSTLPLTGENNRPALLTLAGTLAAVMLLLTTANALRNRRSRRARHTTRRTQADGR
jgi:surface protein